MEVKFFKFLGDMHFNYIFIHFIKRSVAYLTIQALMIMTIYYDALLFFNENDEIFTDWF